MKNLIAELLFALLIFMIFVAVMFIEYYTATHTDFNIIQYLSNL